MRPVRRLGISLVALVAMAMAQGCGGAQRDAQARAELDQANETIVYPISQFRISDADLGLVSRARQTVLRECLSTRGFAGDPPVETPPGRDRPYGIWSVDWAERYGFARPAGAQPTVQQDQDPAWVAAQESCSQQNAEALAAMTPPELAGADLVSARIAASAYEQAAATPEWAAALTQWRECLTAHGLTPRAEAWSSQQAEDIAHEQRDATGAELAALTEREIRVATTEAECNIGTRLTQRLADLEAGYQATQIREEEAALAQEKAANAEALTAARAALARGR